MSINIIVVHFPSMRVHFWPTCEKILDEQRRPTWSLFKSQICVICGSWLTWGAIRLHLNPTWTEISWSIFSGREAIFQLAFKVESCEIGVGVFSAHGPVLQPWKRNYLTWISFFTFVESDFHINEFIKIVGSLLRGLFSPRYLPVQGIYLKYRK